MKVKFTYIDALTGISAAVHPLQNGGMTPEFITFGFALESQYPSNMPVYYGTLVDESQKDHPAILEILTDEEYQAAYDAEIAAREQKLQAALLTSAKTARQTEVDAIVVTTSDGKKFDGDEMSQTRMARAIVAMNDVDQIDWVLSDNSVVKVNKALLSEALRLAGQAMTEIWVKPYQPSGE